MASKSASDEEDRSPVMAAASILASAASDNCNRTDQDPSSNDQANDTRSETLAGSKADEYDPSTVTHEQRWEAMYIRLKAFKEKHGNCLVPNRYPEDTQLGSWVSAQRRQYKIVTSGGNESAAMTQERAQKLKAIGFEWTTTNPRNVPWDTRYDELKDFVANYGHAEVPMRWEENPQLSNWVSKQRHQYKLMLTNRPSRLTDGRVKLLSDIGFVWEASRRRLLDGGSGGEDEDTDGGSSPKRSPVVPRQKKARVRGKSLGSGGPGPEDNNQHSNNEAAPSVPVFAEGRRGRFGMDPPAPTGSALMFAQQMTGPGAAAGQAGVLQANLGLWAAMAASQGGFIHPGQVAPAAVAAAGGAPLNPAMFMMQFGASGAAAMPGSPVVAFAPGPMGASVIQVGVVPGVQEKPGELSVEAGSRENLPPDLQQQQNPEQERRRNMMDAPGQSDASAPGVGGDDAVEAVAVAASDKGGEERGQD